MAPRASRAPSLTPIYDRPVNFEVEGKGGGEAASLGTRRRSDDEAAGGVVSDRAIVEQQLGRAPRAFRRVAVRCPFGRPAVTEQSPYDDQGEPFPTTYYLTCPHLVAAVARVEAGGGVERWSGRAAGDPLLRASLARTTEEQRALRRELAGGVSGHDGGESLELGIGGSSRPEKLKCLHAHVAYALARPSYELGVRIVAGIGELWPPGACCTTLDE